MTATGLHPAPHVPPSAALVAHRCEECIVCLRCHSGPHGESRHLALAIGAVLVIAAAALAGFLTADWAWTVRL